MSDLIFWLLTVYAIGLAALPVTYLALPNLVDRGFGLVRPIGLLLIGSAVWIMSLAKVLPNASWSWWLIAVIVAAAGWGWLLWRERRSFGQFVRRRWLHIVIVEAIFLVFFAVFAFIKAMDPDISHTEKPMDLTMLNAVMSAHHAPPTDLWLSGFPIAYYYFGYWMFGGISQMSGVAASIGYNLALATIAALSASAIFSLVTNLVRRDGGTNTQMFASGAAAVAFLLLISNLNGAWELISFAGVGTDGFYEWLAIKGVDLNDGGSGWRPTGFWWWWASSRVINRFSPDGTELDFTIQEFPFFSLILGDLHPHLMSLPFVLVLVSLSANLLFSRVRWGFGWFKHNPISALVMILAVGSAGFINTWDMLWMLLAFGGVIYFKSYRENGGVHLKAITVATPAFLALTAVGAALFANYYFVTAQSQIQFPPIVPTRYATRPIHFLTVWGGLLSAMAVFVVITIAPAIRGEIAVLRRITLARTLPAIAAERLPWIGSIGLVSFLYLAWAVSHYAVNDNATATDIITRLPLSSFLAAAFVLIFVTVYRRGMRGADDGAQIVLMLLATACLLLYVAELFRLHDFFGGRHNTVFKFYYQVWIFFAVAGGYAIYFWMRHQPGSSRLARYLNAVAIFIAAILIALSLYYPFAATAAKSSESGTEFTLDGLKFLEIGGSDIPEAMDWIRENVSNDDVIAEASGTSYSKFGRFSGWTGRPAILGWAQHQSQWRGGDEWWVDRDRDLERIYNSADDSETLTLLERYSADYVVISPNEREKYTELDVSKFDRIAKRAFENQQVIIFALGE